MTQARNFLDGCLFFKTNALSRYLLKIAQQEFKCVDLSPAHASLMLIVYDNPGISPKELSQILCLTPSTITRFMDALVKKDLLVRKTRGKQAFIYPSLNGLSLKGPIARAYKRLYEKYTRIIGEKMAHHLSFALSQTIEKMETALENDE